MNRSEGTKIVGPPQKNSLDPLLVKNMNKEKDFVFLSEGWQSSVNQLLTLLSMKTRYSLKTSLNIAKLCSILVKDFSSKLGI